MEMGNRVVSVLPHVEHEAVAAVGDALRLRHPPGQDDHVGHHLGVAVLDGGGIVDVVPGDNEDVHGRLRVQIAEGHGVVGAVHDVGGQVTGDDTAEDACTGGGGVAHRVTLL